LFIHALCDIYICSISREENPRLKTIKKTLEAFKTVQVLELKKKPKTSHIIAAAAFPLPSVAGLLN
jgi:hypothetical protein